MECAGGALINAFRNTNLLRFSKFCCQEEQPEFWFIQNTARIGNPPGVPYRPLPPMVVQPELVSCIPATISAIGIASEILQLANRI